MHGIHALVLAFAAIAAGISDAAAHEPSDFGRPAPASRAKRTIAVEMSDAMRFTPAEMKHDEPNMIQLAAGKRGELVWQFTQRGEFHYGCLVPGHFEAGMVGKITVK